MKKDRVDAIRGALESAEQNLASGDEDDVADSLADMIKAVQDLLPEVQIEDFSYGDSVIVIKDTSGAWQQFVGRHGRVVRIDDHADYPVVVRLEGSTYDIRCTRSEIRKVGS